MNNEKEKAFQKWLVTDPDFGWTAEEVFTSGWDAAFESRPVIVDAIRSVARQVERAAIRDRIMELAEECFCDDRAASFRVLAKQLFGKLP